MNLKGKTYAVRGDRSKETLRVSNPLTQLTLKTEGRATVGGLGAVVLAEGLYITSPAAAEFNSNYGGFTVNGELYNGTVVISNREPSAIDGVPYDATQSYPTAIYDYSGRQIENSKYVNHQLPKGLNILRMADGTVRKQLR